MIVKVVLLLLLGIVITAAANILIAKGMRGTNLEVRSAAEALRAAGRVITNGFLVGGGLLLFVSFLIWLTLLSKTDLSLLLPLTALDYVLNAFLSKIYLHEQVSPLRWAGTAVIFCGVIVVVLS